MLNDIDKKKKKKKKLPDMRQANEERGHTQFRGQRYCPEAPGQIPKEEWLAMKSKEAEAKAKSK